MTRKTWHFEVSLFILAHVCLPLTLAAFFHAWPLGNTTCAYDVITGADAITPKLSACGPLGGTHPMQSYKPLKVEGQVTPYLDLQVNAPFDGDFAFSLSILPSHLSGVVLDYLSNSSCIECLTSLTAELHPSGNLVVTLSGIDNTGAPAGPDVLNESLALTTGAWSYINLGADVSGDKLLMERFNVSTDTKTSSLQVYAVAVRRAKGLAVPGRLRLGARLDGTSGFLGEVACATVANKKKDPSLSENSLACSDQATWLYRPPTAPAFKTPYVYVFPLYNKLAGYDVIYNVSRKLATSFSDMRPSSDVTRLGYGSLAMDGSPLAIVDVSLNFGLLQKDFSIGLYVNFASSSCGVLLHAKASLTSGIRTVTLTLNSTHVTATLKDGLAKCGEVKAARSVQGWSTLSIGRRGNSLNLDLGGSRTSSTDNCTANMTVANGTLGSIRLGGSFSDEDEGFHGNLACAVVFDVTFTSASSASSEIVSACKLPHVFPTAPADQKPLLRDARSTLLASDQEPDVIFTPMTSFKVASVTACAKACQQWAFCRSFAMSPKSKGKSENSRRTCRLYDQVTKTQLVSSPGTKYYAHVSPRILQNE